MPCERLAALPLRSIATLAFRNGARRSCHCLVQRQIQLDCRISPWWRPQLCSDKRPATFDCTKWCHRRSKACWVQSDPSTADTSSRKMPPLDWDMNNPWFHFPIHFTCPRLLLHIQSAQKFRKSFFWLNSISSFGFTLDSFCIHHHAALNHKTRSNKTCAQSRFRFMDATRLIYYLIIDKIRRFNPSKRISDARHCWPRRRGTKNVQLNRLVA